MRESMQTIKLVSIVFDALSAMDEREIDLLIQGKATLRVVEKSKNKKAIPLDDTCLDEAISDDLKSSMLLSRGRMQQVYWRQSINREKKTSCCF